MSGRQRLLSEGPCFFFVFLWTQRKEEKQTWYQSKGSWYSVRLGCGMQFEVGDISPEQTKRCERAKFWASTRKDGEYKLLICGGRETPNNPSWSQLEFFMAWHELLWVSQFPPTKTDIMSSDEVKFYSVVAVAWIKKFLSPQPMAKPKATSRVVFAAWLN